MYLLYYDCDNGSREDWNIFYTPVEVFSTKEKRDARIAYIKEKLTEKVMKALNFEFHTEDLESIDISADSELNGSYTFEEIQEDYESCYGEDDD